MDTAASSVRGVQSPLSSGPADPSPLPLEERGGWTGRLHVQFAPRMGKTVLMERYTQSPLKISKTHAMSADGPLYVCMMDASPGMMEGDRYDLRVTLEPGSHVYMTNQAYTKIHPARTQGASLRQHLALRGDACLEWFPEAILPYADSQWESDTQVVMDSDSVLMMGDILTPGRTGRGERMLYRKLINRLQVLRSGRLSAWERIILEPATQMLTGPASFGDYTHLAAFWLFAPNPTKDLLQDIRNLISTYPEVKAGASTTAHGDIAVKILCRRVWEAEQLLSGCRRISYNRLFGQLPPPVRK